MSTYISLDNLARYDANAKDRAGRLYADASAACWQKTEKAGAVTCVPAPETPLEPVVEFLFKETLPEGTKGPSNPSTIAGVSEVTITRCGKNLIPYPYSSSSIEINGVTFTSNSDGSVLANGIASSNAYFYASYVSTSPYLLNGYTYTLSGCPSGGSSTTYYFRHGSYQGSKDVGGAASFVASESGRNGNLACVVLSGTNVSNIVFKPQLELGPSATEFELYAGADYAIDLPSTFYGGTLDVATGKLTVTHRMVEPSSGTVDISDRPALLPLEYTDTYGRTITSADGTSLDCGTSGGQIVYRLANPYIVQINPTPIDSLPALGKASPRINTVYTDAESVQVGYAEHPAYTEELINNAILALGGDI